MHQLHKILVKINGRCPIEADGRDELIFLLRNRAERMTEDYYGQAFDWRETDTAGRNVILSKDNIDKFIDELNRCIEQQKHQIEDNLKNICMVSYDLNELVKMFYNKPSSVPAWYLRCLAELLYGVYTFDSGFFNTEEYTARIAQSTVDDVKNSPNDWALVMFDYHI